MRKERSMTESSLLKFLQAAHTLENPGQLHLFHELDRIHQQRKWNLSEFIGLSVKFSLGSLNRNRLDSVAYTLEAETPFLHRSLQNAAPTEAVQQLLEQPGNKVTQWLRESERSFSYLAVDLENRVFKIYLFDRISRSFLEGKNLWHLLPRLHQASYIDCLEINLDQPIRCQRPAYFKLRAHLDKMLVHSYRPHPQIENRLLSAVPDAKSIITRLAALSKGLRKVNDSVIKLRYEPGGASLGEEIQRFCQSSYSVSMNIFDPSNLKYINDHQADILSLGDSFACRDQAKAWLDAIQPFGCYITYLSVGSNFVSIYYKQKVKGNS
jgi:hypothetical protein